MLFLPGAGGDPQFWRPAGDRLPSNWSKTYLAWPGLGAQSPVDGVAGLDGLVGIVESHLGREVVDLVAQSMGGVVALLTAIKNPARVRRLVLCVTSGGIPMDGLGAHDWREDYHTAFPNASDWIYSSIPDLTQSLVKIIHPVQLIWGGSDPISPIAVGKRLEALLTGASMCIVEGGDHDLAVVHADEVAQIIERHLR